MEAAIGQYAQVCYTEGTTSHNGKNDVLRNFCFAAFICSKQKHLQFAVSLLKARLAKSLLVEISHEDVIMKRSARRI